MDIFLKKELRKQQVNLINMLQIIIWSTNRQQTDSCDVYKKLNTQEKPLIHKGFFDGA